MTRKTCFQEVFGFQQTKNMNNVKFQGPEGPLRYVYDLKHVQDNVYL